MFKIENSKIWLTCGDTAEFRPVIENYTAQEGDIVTFTAKKVLSDQELAINKSVAAGEDIAFAAEDTSSLTPGTYLYDLRLETTDGGVSTFVSQGELYLVGAVNESN